MLARIRKSAEGNDKGFTLVELLVVMIIIGILAAVAIPVFLNQRTKAVDTSIKSDLRTAAQELETYFVDEQEYPATTGYVAIGTGGTTAGTIADLNVVKITKGNLVQYKTVGTGATAGYCLRGSSANSNAIAPKYFVYDSVGGGLVPGKPAAIAAGSTCA